MIKIAVFASGTGTNFRNIVEDKSINAKFSLFVCDRPKAKCIEIAKENDIDSFIFKAKDYKSKEEYEKIIMTKLDEKEIDLIVLAGYMRILSKEFVEKYNNKIINIHPSLLPLYKGATAVKDAFEDGKNIFGVTVHYVNEDVDGGEIIIQEQLENTKGLSLEEIFVKVHELEYKLYPMAIKSIIKE
ncbi:MAG: phosphoribosylglycinamide formyltransferase [Lachnospirales bacterium]